MDIHCDYDAIRCRKIRHGMLS